MKKIIITSLISGAVGVLMLVLNNYLEFLHLEFFLGLLFLLLPIVVGIVMVLIQDEEKSYKFLPKLFLGAFLSNFIFFVSLFLITLFNLNDMLGYSILEMIIGMIPFFLFLFGLVVFGGLIGLVIRGSSLLIKARRKK